MGEELTRMKRVRGGHKASVTRMITRVEETLGAEGDLDLARLNQMRMSLKEKLDEIKVLDAEILALVGDEELENEISQADEYKERIYSTLVRISKACETPAAAPRPTATGATAPAASGSKVRLPKLTIKPFNGKLVAWTPFWDSFNSAVHENTELSPVDKFNYLRSMVTHTALDAISGLTLTGANYDEAIEILRKRFGNKQLIINKHMEHLLAVDSVTSQHDIKGLRQLYDVIETNVRSLKSLGVSPESYGSLLSSVLMSKLPTELRLIVSRKFADEDQWDFAEILHVIEDEIRARERSSSQAKEPRRTKELATGAALLIDSPSPHCCFCQQQHLSQNCQTIASFEDRRESLRKSGRCYVCLGRGHVSRNCRSRIKCLNCKGRHHLAICRNRLTETSSRNSTSRPTAPTVPTLESTNTLNPEAPTFNPPTTGSTTLWTHTGKSVLLQTAQAIAYNPECVSRTLRVRIVMDTGSQRSYITHEARARLDLSTTGRQRMTIATFGAAQTGGHVLDSVRIGLRMKDGQGRLVTLYSVPTICEPLAPHPVIDYRKAYPHLKNLDLADDPGDAQALHIDILIGADQYWELITGQIKKGATGPVAICTRLGWVLSGPISGQADDAHSLMIHTLHIGAQPPETQTLDDTMKKFWELESFGIPSDDRSLYDELCDTIVFRDGRYEVQLPWKVPRQDPPTNYELSLRRLRGLLNRLKHNPDVLREYDTLIKGQLQQGIVERVEDQTDTAGVHYLPHHPVIRQDKVTTKLRIVYDASAKAGGLSLNDCLNPGPKFDQRILDLLIRFRVHKVAVTADIEKAFLMISVAPRDREFLRFFWVDDPAKDDPKVVVYRFTRVVFGVTASPFLLNATLRHHLDLYSKSHNKLVSIVQQSIYVDDLVTGSSSDEQAYQLYVGAKALLKTGAFNLRKFSTNSPELQARVDEEESVPSTPSVKTFAQVTQGQNREVQEREQRVLGVNWDISSDQLTFSLAELAEQARNLDPTKRNVISLISLISRFYDPLGFLAPIVVRYKVFMQLLVKTKIGWDDAIPDTLICQWQKLISELEQAHLLSIPRCYLADVSGEVISYQLIGYCDASLSAYAAVIYLLIESESGVHMKFVVSKTRVAPLKKQSIPRLELLSAVLLARLMDTTRNSLQSEIYVASYHCFTDSRVALCWIRNVEKSWKPFIQNRVSEIRSLLSVECWRHVPGLENPADIPSRGTTPLELLTNKLWQEGPKMPLAHPCELIDCEIPPECLQELPAKEKQATLLTSGTAKPGIGNLIEVENFSSLSRLINVLTFVLKFCSLLKRKMAPTTFGGREKKVAETYLILEAQASLKEHRNFRIWERQFSLFKDEVGVLRCRGRIDHASNLPYSTKHPILLPSDHHITILYVLRAHARVLHNGVKETLTEMRSQFWVLKGRGVVKKILHRCNVCRRYEGRSCRVPAPPPLPSFRVKEAPPFTSTGVDFAGPLYIKRSEGSQAKVWIVLYTCCVTRAVHLDLVSDMSASTFIRSFKRFSSRRGLPTLMISDNGKAFKAASKIIKSVVTSPRVIEHFSGVGVEWRFNVPKAPWWGGLFERLVGSTKRCLRKALGQSKFSFDELLTALIEIELVLNSRPLTYISPDDLEEPLTPAHLLVGRRLMSLPDHLVMTPEVAEEQDSSQLNSRLRYLNRALDSFWKRWRKEYLLELREAHRHHHSSGDPHLSEGDVVVVHSDDHPRSFWKLGRIERVIVGADGQKRAATVRVCKKGHASTLNRPIQHLFPLEVTSTSDLTTQKEATTDVQESTTESTGTRSRRSAAVLARDRILAQAVTGMDTEQ